MYELWVRHMDDEAPAKRADGEDSAALIEQGKAIDADDTETGFIYVCEAPNGPQVWTNR